MKKQILTSLLILGSITAFTQSKFSTGIRLGTNIAKLSNIEGDLRTAMHGGVFFNIRFSDMYQMQPEIMYSAEGIDNYGNTNNDFKVDYLSVSLANKLFFTDNVGLFAVAGPSIDIRVEDNIGTRDIFDLVPVDLSFFAGFGYEFSMGLGFEARYKLGITDNSDVEFINNSNSTAVNIYNTQTRVFQLGVTYRFNRKSKK